MRVIFALVLVVFVINIVSFTVVESMMDWVSVTPAKNGSCGQEICAPGFDCRRPIESVFLYNFAYYSPFDLVTVTRSFAGQAGST